MVENIIKTVNASQENKLTDVLVWEKTSGRFRKINLTQKCTRFEYTTILTTSI